MKFVKMFLALVGLAVLFVFVRDNTGKIVVKFWEYATPEIEIFLVLIITFVLGMIVASFGSTLKIIKLKRQLKNAGTSSAERTKESKKDKKSKHKKDETEKAPSDVSSTSAAPSGSAVGYAATAATVAEDAYTTSATAGSTVETASTDAGSSAPVDAKKQDEEVLADPGEEEDNTFAPGATGTEERDSDEPKPTEEVISLPADETTAEEDRK